MECTGLWFDSAGMELFLVEGIKEKIMLLRGFTGSAAASLC